MSGSLQDLCQMASADLITVYKPADSQQQSLNVVTRRKEATFRDMYVYVDMFIGLSLQYVKMPIRAHRPFPPWILKVIKSLL